MAARHGSAGDRQSTSGTARGAATPHQDAAKRRLIIALDFDRLTLAYEMAKQLVGLAGMFKVGSQLFTAEGPLAVKKLSKLGRGIFLDLKYHDIPSTVARAIAATAPLPGIRLVNMHTVGGLPMMHAAVRALRSAPMRWSGHAQLLGVTVLTSLSAQDLRRVGISGSPSTTAVKLARLAKQAGLDGVITAAREAGRIRQACGPRFVIVVPGVRPASPKGISKAANRADDQSRVATPTEAIRAGADYLVVGRPITGARDPCAAAMAILEEMAEAQRSPI